jgi:hypothetical protein
MSREKIFYNYRYLAMEYLGFLIGLFPAIAAAKFAGEIN